VPDPGFFNITINAASLFLPDSEPTPLDGEVQYTGDRLYCAVKPLGTALAFHITDKPTADLKKAVEVDGKPQEIGAVSGGPFTKAIVDITSKGKTVKSAAPRDITYLGGIIAFHLRFDPEQKIGAIYVDEDPDATRVSAVQPMVAAADLDVGAEPAAAVLPPAQLTFIAVRDDAVKSVPFEAVFIHNLIEIPLNVAKDVAGSLVAQRGVDAGGEVGPMGFQIPGG
jgi:hypothetical protein